MINVWHYDDNTLVARFMDWISAIRFSQRMVNIGEHTKLVVCYEPCDCTNTLNCTSICEIVKAAA